MTEEENEVMSHLIAAWNGFVELEKLHADDTPDFRRAILEAQRILVSRDYLRNKK